MYDDEEGAPVGRQRLVQWEDGKGCWYDVPPSVKRSLETKYRGQMFGRDLKSILDYFHEEAYFVQKRTITMRLGQRDEARLLGVPEEDHPGERGNADTRSLPRERRRRTRPPTPPRRRRPFRSPRLRHPRPLRARRYRVSRQGRPWQSLR